MNHKLETTCQNYHQLITTFDKLIDKHRNQPIGNDNQLYQNLKSMADATTFDNQITILRAFLQQNSVTGDELIDIIAEQLQLVVQNEPQQLNFTTINTLSSIGEGLMMDKSYYGIDELYYPKSLIDELTVSPDYRLTNLKSTTTAGTIQPFTYLTIKKQLEVKLKESVKTLTTQILNEK